MSENEPVERYSLTDMLDALSDPRIIAFIAQRMDTDGDKHFNKAEVIGELHRILREADSDTIVAKRVVPFSKEMEAALATAREAAPAHSYEQRVLNATTAAEREQLAKEFLENPRVVLQLKLAAGLSLSQQQAQALQAVAQQPELMQEMAEDLDENEGNEQPVQTAAQAFSALKAYDFQHVDMPTLEEVFPNLQLPETPDTPSKGR